jgi:hypothetical protein
VAGCPTPAIESDLWFRGSQDLNCRKIATIARHITREQGKMSHGGVRANVEVRQRRTPRTSATAVFKEALPRQKKGFPGQRFALIQTGRQGLIQVVCSAHSASALPDQSLQFRSFVAISSRTLLSTSTPRHALRRARRRSMAGFNGVAFEGGPRRASAP